MGKLRAINTPHPLAVVDWQETEIDRSSSLSETTDKTQHPILHSGTREMGRKLGHKLHHVVYSTGLCGGCVYLFVSVRGSVRAYLCARACVWVGPRASVLPK